MIVAADLLDPERLRLPEFGRQHDDGKVGIERLRQIDDAQPAGGDVGAERNERGGGVHHRLSCRSRRGSSAHLAWISLAMSPTTTSSRPSRRA